jgi:predicted dehydrogenase
VTLSEPLGLGLVGCGGFGRFALAAVADLPGIDVRAVTDVDPDRAAAVAATFGASVVPGVGSLLAEPMVDVVMIATPPVTHGSMARAAAEAGKHVFCEKPLATSLPDASAAIEAADRRNIKLTVDYVMRWNPLYWLIQRLQALHRADDEPVLGQLRRFAVENLAGDERLPADHWFWDRATSGGIFIEHGVHFFDAASWLLGDPPISVAAIQAARASGEIDTVVASTVHAGGATATYAHSFAHPDAAEYQSVLLDWGFAHGTLRGWIPVDLELDIWTDEGGATAIRAAVDNPRRALAVPGLRASGVERIELAITQIEGVGAPSWRGRGEIRPVTCRVRLGATLGGEEAKAHLFRESVRAGFADLVDAIRTGRKPTVSGSEAHESLATAVAAQAAADSGRMQELHQLHLTGVV